MFIPEGGDDQHVDGGDAPQLTAQVSTGGASDAGGESKPVPNKAVANSQAEPFIAKPKISQNTAAEASAKPAPKPTPKPAKANPKKAEPKKAAPASSDILNADGTANAWVLQVISSSSETKAKSIVKQLQGKDYRAYYRSAKTPKGLIYRVYVGPKINRRTAERLKRELDKLLKVDALILRFQP
nr:SPOR domain-containing protein [Pseudoteredinibacter isoporae]